MDAWVPVLIDGVLALLLIGAMVACWVVSNRLSTIREGQDELRKLVDDLNVAMSKAQSSADSIKKASNQASNQLDEEMTKARSMLDELSLMTASANNLADRLEKSVDTVSKSRQPATDTDMNEQKDILDKLRQAR